VHEAGVVHRDLKPSNILLSPKGPRIIDFGIAWATGASTLTHVGTAVGSPGFLAPEQVRGAAVTPATDVFAFGATLAYAATADSPFGQGSSEVMLYRVVHEEPDLVGVPDALAPLVHACLAKDPQERPSTVQLSGRLSEIATREARGLGVRPPRPERPTGRRAEEYAQQRTERRPAAGAGAGTGAGAGAGAAAKAGGVASNGGRGRTGSRPGTRTPPPSLSPGSGSGSGGSGARTPARTPARAAARTPAGRRPAAPDSRRRLLRQRVFVFVIVTLLAAVCIAVLQAA
jgi:hypothetical protein